MSDAYRYENDPRRPIKCAACRGEGAIEVPAPQWDDPYFTFAQPCFECGGDGWVLGEEPEVTLDDLDAEDETRHPCSMGVGCEEAGVCYATAMGEPGQCPRKSRQMIAPLEGATAGNSGMNND